MQLVMPFAPSASYEVADFIHGNANEEALALVERWPDWPYSMLLVHGPKGSGKTHLAHVFAARARAHFIAPARIGQVPADQILTGNHAWIIDGLADVTDAPALAQLINHVRARGDYLVITATDAASHLAIALPDLRSRLVALPSVALGAPDDALWMGVMAKQFADRQLRIAPDVLQYAAQHLERSFEAAQQFAQAMDQLSLERGRAITLPLVRETLKNPDWHNL